ncbi:integrase [Deefgea piscis]|uniref:integrase n=1 Tax=Deefgea piscis TaxID=2739061 RepID=UPI001C825FBE|nr:site-specific integrase [Deefgea piscis]QZA80279.1 site-specific integrase [Deefgea piscis]
MATITKRTGRDGTLSFRAQVRVKRDGKVIYSEVKTFEKEKLAKDWAAKVEASLKADGAIDRRKIARLTVGQLLRRYIDEIGETQKFGRTKRYTMENLINKPIAKILVSDLTPADIVEHCKLRHVEGAGPATTSQDVIYLGSALGVARPLWGLAIDKRPVEDAYPMLHKLKLIGRSDVRDRRITAAELKALLEYEPKAFQHGRTPPMFEIIQFAIWSCMRQEEIHRLLWMDVDESKRTVMIRQRKDPGKKEINDQIVPLLGDAWTILQRQPKTDARIFPYNSRSTGAAFRRMCKALKIETLTFHDLRHEGISRLFEAGYQIQEVAMVSGHKTWGSLRRYTNLRPEDLHDKHELQMIAARPSDAVVPEPALLLEPPKLADVLRSDRR